jgi:tRNA A37 threonylcarbamoyladenosine synthetase subunit TsaC/SUA5/YrdC
MDRPRRGQDRGAALRPEQVEKYLDVAKANGFEAVLTISNQITASPTESPIPIDGRKTKKVALRHLSWWQVMTEARVQHEHRGIADTDQAWILGELIAYLDHEKAGAGGFDDMGESWVAVRDGARQHTLRLADQGVRDVASRWEQFVQYLALGLCQTLGRNVEAMWPRKLGAADRLDAAVRLLVDQGRLEATIRVPDAAAPVDLAADLRTRLFVTSVELPAPREGRPKTRINWMLRQLKEAPDSLRVEVRYPNAKETVSSTVKEARDKPDRLLFAADPHREPRAFRLSLAQEMGAKRGKIAGSFVNDSKRQALDFYRTIVQGLRAWSASAPKLPGQIEPASPVASPEPPDFTDTGREYGDASLPTT